MTRADEIPQQDCYCMNLRKATNKVIRFYDAQLLPAGINSQQYSFLVTLKANGPMSITAAADLMGLDRTTVSRNLNVLEQKGMLTVSSDKGRKKKILLSEEGCMILKKADRLWENAQEKLKETLGVGEMELLLEQLRRIADL